MPAFTLPTPADFRFLPTLRSHGWGNLQPFQMDADRRLLQRLHRLQDGSTIRFVVTAVNDAALSLMVDEPLTQTQEQELRTTVGRIFGFQQSVSEFHALVQDDPHYGWIARVGAGRMLVSPTVWEDLAKTLLTTNITWRQTKTLVERLVLLGDTYAGGGNTFPTPEQVAALTPERLNEHIRAGYRGPYLHALAERIANGTVDVEAWRDPDLPAQTVYKQMQTLKGFGPYAAGAMLRLLGHFDELGLDSECRAAYRRLHNAGQPATDVEIAAFYARFGRWQGLAVWMDTIRDWMLQHEMPEQDVS